MIYSDYPAFPADAFAIHKDLPREQILKLQQSLGLTKRELFAAMAMQGLLHLLVTLDAGDYGREKRAQMAVMEADALIAELNKESK